MCVFVSILILIFNFNNDLMMITKDVIQFNISGLVFVKGFLSLADS